MRAFRGSWVAVVVLGASCAGRCGGGGGDPELPGITKVDRGLQERLRAAAGGGAQRYVNRLALEGSPYLLQHAHNPVNWFPWGDDALERARREDRPVFLSIGYATCHWCHVMEEESFQDQEVAALINARFIPVKVDREERPDLDERFMQAVLALSGSGGWPMTLVLTPGGEPFFAATYVPARDGDRGARRGLLSVLRELADRYATRREQVLETARQTSERLRAATQPAPPGDLPGPDAIRAAAVGLARRFDVEHGGFGRAPKFPMPGALELLLRYHRRTGDERALAMVAFTLEQMANGGIRDQLGGGFHRYSTDERWVVPHFEKMLYDNALLAAVYLDASQAAGRARLAEVAKDTLEYLDRELSVEGGGFASATDADSKVPGGEKVEEGRYFTWTREEVVEALGEERGAAIATYFGVEGPGRSVLHVAAPPPEELRDTVDQARAELLQARRRRPAPARDDQVVAAWNGLAISAFARGAEVLAEPRYARRAAAAADFLSRHLRGHRTWRAGTARGPATLDDLAFVAQGMLDLFEATQEPRWLNEAVAIHQDLEARFLDPATGAFFFTPEGRRVIDEDGVEPSGNAIAIRNLRRLGELTGNARWREEAVRALRAMSAAIQRGHSAEWLVGALEAERDEPAEIVLVAPAGGSAAPFQEVLARTYLPNRTLLVATEGAELERLEAVAPLLKSKRAQRGATTAYVCRHSVCERPTGDVKVFEKQLAGVAPLYPDKTPEPLPGP
ncbi:MAG TPA: thioredoxin domain-containing protein [Myxococcales bacterium]|nr:thioredoxin domain-containing protein [Myxococcales bacterium]